MARSVLLCGYYGEHNLGDDALLESLLGQLPVSVTPLVTAYDQPLVEERHGVATVRRRSLGQVLRAADLKDKRTAEAIDPMPMTPAAFGQYIRAEVGRWTVLARERKITLED